MTEPIKPKSDAKKWTARRRLADAVLLLVLMLLGSIYVQIYKPAGADEAYYLGQLSSLLEDGDLDLRNDVLSMVNTPPMTLLLLTRVQPSGRLDNVFSIGPALVWTPAYAVGRAWVHAGLTDDLRRWGHPHVAAMHVLSLMLLGAVVWMARRLMRFAGASQATAVLGTISLLVGSPLLFYGFANYGGSHLPSVLAAFLYMATLPRLGRNPLPLNGFISGLALGFLCIMRWQDAIFGVMAFLMILNTRKGRAPRTILTTGAATILGVIVFVSLQSHAWAVERGTILTIPQGSGFMHWTSPKLAEFLFAGYRGLLPWAPIYGLGFLGLLLPWKCRCSSALRTGAILVLLGEVYVNACVWDWWSGASYGQRRMISCLPLVALGLANFSLHFSRVVSRAMLLGSLAVICAWGIVTLHLHLSLAQDLALLVTGGPSSTSAARDQIHQNTAAHARQVLRQWKPGFSEANVFEYDFIGGAIVGRVATIGLASLVLAGAFVAMHFGKRRLLKGTFTLYVFTMLFLHVRLSTGARTPEAEYAVWGRIADDAREGKHSEALAGVREALARGVQPAGRASPEDAYRYLAFALLAAERRLPEAREIYRELKAGEYQSLELTPMH